MLTAEEENELSMLHFRVYTDLPVTREDYVRMLDLETKDREEEISNGCAEIS